MLIPKKKAIAKPTNVLLKVIKKFFPSSPLLVSSKIALPTSTGEGRIRGLRLPEKRLQITTTSITPLKLIDIFNKLLVEFFIWQSSIY
ncbi:hypothetical protein ES708_08888 [subsurface metagenome]